MKRIGYIHGVDDLTEGVYKKLVSDPRAVTGLKYVKMQLPENYVIRARDTGKNRIVRRFGSASEFRRYAESRNYRSYYQFEVYAA